MHLVMKCQAMDVEMRRQKVFEECRLRYSKVLGKEWGDEAKRKAAEDKAKRDSRSQSRVLPIDFQKIALKTEAPPKLTVSSKPAEVKIVKT